jgi:hypothetical protein
VVVMAEDAAKCLAFRSSGDRHSLVAAADS